MIVSVLRQPVSLYSWVVVVSLHVGSAAAFAQSTSDCSSLSAERISLTQGEPSSHMNGAVTLLAGEMLQMRMTTGEGNAGQGGIAISEGGETGVSVIAGAAPQETLYTIPEDGQYTLAFSSDGAAPLTFEVSCETAGATFSSSATPEAFVKRRTGRLLSGKPAQTNLSRRGNKPDTLDKVIKSTTVLNDEGQPTKLSVTTSLQNLAAAEGRNLADDKFDLWVEGRVSQFAKDLDDDDVRYKAEGSAGAVNFGADYLLKPGLMIGALVQFDQYREDYDAFNATTSSEGMLFGPYVSYRISPGLVLDTQIAWGNSDNASVLSDGTQVDFETERQLLRGKLTGSRQLLGLKFTPTVALSVIEDRFANPEALPEGAAGENGSFSGQLDVGSSVSYRFSLDDGSFIQPNVGLSTDWTLDSLDALAINGGKFNNDGGAKAQAGVTVGTEDGVSIKAGGAIKGIGQDDYPAWNGRVTLTAPLN